jgi:hypothetical protein
MRLVWYIFIPFFLLALTKARAETSSLTGRFQGTGRACYGTLSVEPKTISWLTPFSQCKSTPYEIVERDSFDGKMKTTYRLKRGAASCRYTVLVLTHSGADDGSGWEITGYGSEQSYRTDKSSGYTIRSEDMMSCPLVRERRQ